MAAELKMGLKLDHTIERVQVGENMAWAAGPYTVTIPGKDGASTESHGAWLQVLKRDSGSWKIQAAGIGSRACVCHGHYTTASEPTSWVKSCISQINR